MFLSPADEVQRAIRYLRFLEDDADEIVPSLWAGRRRTSSSRADAPVDAEPRVTGPATPTPTPATPAVTEPAAPPIAPGLPGASPFMR